MIPEIQNLREANSNCAQILADMFSASVLHGWRVSERKDLYEWEQRAIDWLREWRSKNPDVPINAWTSKYLTIGPPPWSKG